VVKRSHDELGSAVSELRKASAHDQDLAGVTESVAMAIEQASDIARQIRHLAERVNRDPQELERVESRLTLLGELRRKYGHNVEEINQFGKEAGARRAELAGLLARAETLGEDLQRAEASLADAASLLTAARRAAGKRMTTAALRHLHDLGFSDPVLRLEVNPDEPGPSGADRMTLLFASDSRLAPAEVGRVASGGELSRLVLALRLAGGAGGSATFAFDEIDAGVGGVTAIALGRKLKSLAVEHQVLCVTHLPQVAAHADTHFAVEREGNTAVLRRLEGEERRIELARMLAGMPESERGKEAADELLTLARAR
jgi:DNA repair protein RecN (Recombination protein N)